MCPDLFIMQPAGCYILALFNAARRDCPSKSREECPDNNRIYSSVEDERGKAKRSEVNAASSVLGLGRVRSGAVSGQTSCWRWCAMRYYWEISSKTRDILERWLWIFMTDWSILKGHRSLVEADSWWKDNNRSW